MKFSDGMKLNYKKSVNRGKKVFKPAQDVLEFDCEFKEECKKDQINKQSLTFKILGQNKDKKAKISEY